MPVTFSVGGMPVSKVDLVLTVGSSRAGKLGELHVSAGGVDWWPRGAHTQKRFYRWSQLADLLEEGKPRSGARIPKRAPLPRAKRAGTSKRRRARPRSA